MKFNLVFMGISSFFGRMSSNLGFSGDSSQKAAGYKPIVDGQYEYDPENSQIIRHNDDGSKSYFPVKVRVPTGMVGVGSGEAEIRFKQVELVVRAAIEVFKELDKQQKGDVVKGDVVGFRYSPGKIIMKKKDGTETTVDVKKNPKLSKKVMNLANALGLSTAEARAQGRAVALYKMGALVSKKNVVSDKEFNKKVEDLNKKVEDLNKKVEDLNKKKVVLPRRERSVSNIEAPKKASTISSTERDKFIEELKTTEKTFSDDLEVLVNFLKTNKNNLSPEALKLVEKLISKYEVILNYSKEFYVKLEAGEDPLDSFMKLSDFLAAACSDIANDYMDLLNEMEALKEDKSFENFKNEFQKANLGKSIESFLITPVQRFPRFEMLMSGVLKNTPEGDPNHEKALESYEKAKRSAAQINENVRTAEKNKLTSRFMGMMDDWRGHKDSIQKIILADNKYAFIAKKNENITDLLNNYRKLPQVGYHPEFIQNSDQMLVKAFLIFIDDDQAKMIAEALKDLTLDETIRAQLEKIKNGVIALRGENSRKALILKS